jgi:hypothetical protein
MDQTEGTISIALTAATAALLLECLTKTAVAGPQAKVLADLYAQTEMANAALNGGKKSG